MKYIEILSACNKDLGSCCSDTALASLVDIVRRIMDIFQIIVPIVLLAMLSIQLFKLVMNPEEKGGLKKITNRIIATMLVFLLPVVINVVMSWLPETENFQVAACWKTARDINEYSHTATAKYNAKNDGKRSKILIEEKITSGTSTSTSAGRGSARGQEVVNYALQFVGQRYVYGGSWNGEKPYTPTDCSGFVQGIYRHFGVSLKRTTSTQWADTSSYTKVSTNDIRAGDLAMYGGHVAIFTGNGNEIVHAANSRAGIVITSDYRNGASNFLGVMRIKGIY